MRLYNYPQSLLTSWEEIFKKGQLTLWICLALKDGPKHMADIKVFIVHLVNGTTNVDEQSVYRALRRYYSAEIVDFKMVPSSNGPDKKVYFLTRTGLALLDAFCKRNIVDVFYRDDVRQLIEKE